MLGAETAFDFDLLETLLDTSHRRRVNRLLIIL